MAFSGSSIVIVFIGVVAYATAGPVQAGPNTLQQNEYGGLADFLTRNWDDRRMNQNAKQNLDQIGGGHLVRDTDKQFKDLLNEEESRSTQYLNSASDKQILDTIRREGLFADRFRNGNLINSSLNSVAFADMISHPYSPNLNADQINDQLFMNQLIDRDVPNNVREGDRRIVKNLDQIGGGHLVRNLDQIGGGHLVRNLDQIGGGHLVRNLDQIGGGHLVRDTDKQFKDLLNEEESRSTQYLNSASDKQILDTIRREGLFADRFRNGNLINSSLNSVAFADMISHPYSPNLNADQINDQLFMNQLIDRDVPNNVREGDRRIVKNLDQIGGGHLVRNLDQIGGGHLVRNLDQIGGGHLVRNLDQIGGGHLVRDQIGGAHLVRNLDQIGGGHLVRNLDQIGGGNLVRSVDDYQNAEMKRRVDELASILEKQHFARNLDQIGGGNLVRNLDQIGGGNLVRNLDQIGGGNLVRSLN